jgi:hypothetical protein
MLMGMAAPGLDRHALVRVWHSDLRKSLAQITPGWVVGGGWGGHGGMRASGVPHPATSARPYESPPPFPFTSPRPPGWSISALACSPTEPLFVAAASSPRPLPHGGGVGPGSPGAGRGALTAWNLRAHKKAGVYALPGEPPVASLAFSRSGGLLAAGTACGRAALFDPAARPQPARVWAAGGGAGGGGARVAFRAAGGGGPGPEGSLLTLRGGVLQDWALASLRAPAAAVDVAAAADAALARWRADTAAADAAAPDGGGALGSLDSAAGGDAGGSGAAGDAADWDAPPAPGEGPWSFDFSPEPGGGGRVAVVCGWRGGGGGDAAGAGCVLLYDAAGGVWRPPRVLLASPLLAGRCAVDWHPAADALVCGSGAAGGALLTLQLPPAGGGGGGGK